jgi:sugar lactone lactonase YvrE
MRRDGSFLFANQGEDGGVFALGRDGTVRPFLLEVEGFRLGPTNFVLVDDADRVWVSVSTRRRERHSFAKDTPDGFIACVDRRGARVAADGFVWTNEFRFDADGRWLYVNETMGKRLCRFRVGSDGSLGRRETVAEFGPGDFLDGLAFDIEGAMWITCPVSNRVWRVQPSGERQLLLEDADPAHIAEVEGLLDRGLLRGPKVHEVRSLKLPNLASLAFGGADLKTAYLGVIGAGQVWRFRSPVAGLPMAHWRWG